MRHLSCFISLLCCCVFGLEAQDLNQARQPNIIIILADDLGYGDIGSYGAPYATPNLDGLAKNGMRFTSFYSQPECSPSRAALMTGCYPQRVGIPWVVGPKGPEWTKDKHFIGLNPGETTIAELLKTRNYASACIGKWHLGQDAPHLPTRHGFDEYFGLPYSNDMWPPNQPSFPDLPLIEGEKTIELNPDQAQLTARYTEKAVDFVNRNTSKPFFLYVAHSMPHVPIYASEKFKGKSGRGLYADVIQELDWSVGEIIKAVRKNGMDDNTFIVFTSDNGPWLPYGNHAGSKMGFREGKSTVFEGGVRVPMIAKWPGHIAPGTTCEKTAALFDLLPTIAEIVNAKLPLLPIDGKSILPLLLSKGIGGREAHYYFKLNELQAVRRGKWKLHMPHAYDRLVATGNDGARGRNDVGHIELALYDLEKDPAEENNVASTNPGMVDELRTLVLEFRSDLEKTKREPGKSGQ